MVVILPAGHPLAGESRIDLARLADETWLLPPNDPGCDDYGALVDVCAAAGFVPRPSPHRIGDLSILCDLVAQGVGLTLAQGSTPGARGRGHAKTRGRSPARERSAGPAPRIPLFSAPLLLGLVRDAFEARCVTSG
ncbi:LysR substrate-binding domain-containing protein [Streptomyces cyaneofuscatus]|uniref:LysR substrate-binding domain-containing protein n=1 Tax=Streptomyces cyaneofuscatus TaxID=66883 RepID=UPI003427B386